jgi:formate hydrogenlyase subunit 6/NADH:ubiquinone oxidoreductase subunit I
MLITPTSKRTDDGAKHRDLVFYLPEKRRRFVEALRVLTERTTGTHSATILFSLPKVDAVQCIGCSMCADLCPTGALEAKEEAGMLCITCNATDCVACNLCVDACYKHAISLSPGDESIRSPHRVVVLEQQHKDDLLAPVEDKMSRLLGVGLYRT